MSAPVYLGLVHYPIYNKNGEIITTAITNFDIHDIARTSRTYDIKQYFIIHPLESQAELARNIISYWQDGYGSQYNPDRKEAFSILKIMPDIEKAVEFIKNAEGEHPVIITTDARKFDNTVSYIKVRNDIASGNKP